MPHNIFYFTAFKSEIQPEKSSTKILRVIYLIGYCLVLNINQSGTLHGIVELRHRFRLFPVESRIVYVKENRYGTFFSVLQNSTIFCDRKVCSYIGVMYLLLEENL